MFSVLISLYLSYKKFQIIHHKKPTRKSIPFIHVRSDSSHVFLHQRKKKTCVDKKKLCVGYSPTNCLWFLQRN